MDNTADMEVIAKKSVKGISALTSRTFFVQILAIATQLLLSMYLVPEIFGVFYLVSSIIVFFNYFSDIGLAASLIQKKEEPSNVEYQNVFTIQQILVLTLSIPAIVLAPYIARFYSLDSDGMWLLIAFIVSFFLSSLRTIPTVMLERHLKFEKLVIPQIIENVVYSVSLIVLAVFLQMGITSFTLAVLFRAVVGLIVTYIIQPWPVGISFSAQVTKRLFAYGVPFQANSVLALVKDDLLVIYLSKVLPFAQVGYLGFAQKWAFMPLRLVMDNVIKVTFPAYSRLQHDKEGLTKIVERSIFMIALFIFPIVIGIITLAPLFVQFVPRLNQWQPALFALTMYSLNALVASVSVPLTNFLNATGKIKTTLNIMIFLTLSTWILTVVFVPQYQYNAAAVISVVVATFALLAVYFVKKQIDFVFLPQLYKQLIASLIMGAAVYMYAPYVSSLIETLAVSGAAGILYILVMLLIARKEIQKIITFISKTLRPNL